MFLMISRWIILVTALLLAGSCAREDPAWSFGVMADCQFCAKPTAGRRHYQESPQKLRAALEQFRRQQPEWLVHLGDFIDERQESFAPLLQICDGYDFRIYHVLGNHDFSVDDQYKDGVPRLLGMPARFYSWQNKGWRFIALDGNDLSLYAHPHESARHQQSLAYYQRLPRKMPTYNGAIGAEQIAWLRQQLSAAQRAHEPVILLCHFPLLPAGDSHNLWNAEEIIAVIDDYPCVKAWFNGHDHRGGYIQRNGVHYLTFQGMVDTAENAFALVSIQADAIGVRGFGREPSRVLTIRK